MVVVKNINNVVENNKENPVKYDFAVFFIVKVVRSNALPTNADFRLIIKILRIKVFI